MEAKQNQDDDDDDEDRYEGEANYPTIIQCYAPMYISSIGVHNVS